MSSDPAEAEERRAAGARITLIAYRLVPLRDWMNTNSWIVTDAAGTEYDISDQTTIFLCRCGNSATKPFCDGTHETLHFQAANRQRLGAGKPHRPATVPSGDSP